MERKSANVESKVATWTRIAEEADLSSSSHLRLYLAAVAVGNPPQPTVCRLDEEGDQGRGVVEGGGGVTEG